MQDRRITVRMISEAVGISIGTVEIVLTEDLKRFREKMRKKRPQQCSSGQWWLHQDNAPCHKSTLVTTWMADRGMKVV